MVAEENLILCLIWIQGGIYNDFAVKTTISLSIRDYDHLLSVQNT